MAQGSPSGIAHFGPGNGPDGEISKAAQRACSSAADSTRKQAPLRCSHARSPSSSRSKESTRAASTWLNTSLCTAEISSRSRRFGIARAACRGLPPRIRSPLSRFAPRLPKRCSPNQLGTPRSPSQARFSRSADRSSSPTPRTTTLKALPRRCPSFSLFRCRVPSRTRSPGTSTARAAAKSELSIDSHCRVTAWASFSPAQPICRSGTSRAAAIDSAAAIVAMPVFSISSQTCAPSPQGSYSGSSSTSKSSGETLYRPWTAARGIPGTRAGRVGFRIASAQPSPLRGFSFRTFFSFFARGRRPSSASASASVTSAASRATAGRAAARTSRPPA